MATYMFVSSASGNPNTSPLPPQTCMSPHTDTPIPYLHGHTHLSPWSICLPTLPDTHPSLSWLHTQLSPHPASLEPHRTSLSNCSGLCPFSTAKSNVGGHMPLCQMHPFTSHKPPLLQLRGSCHILGRVDIFSTTHTWAGCPH